MINHNNKVEYNSTAPVNTINITLSLSLSFICDAEIIPHTFNNRSINMNV